MYWLPGSINVYKGVWGWTSYGRRSIITMHFVVNPLFPTLNPGIAWQNSWLTAIQYEFPAICTMAHGDTMVSTKTVQGIGYSDGGDWIRSTDIGTLPQTSAPEAAILIHRVGAGPNGPVAGRFRLGPFRYSLFTDPPRCRWIDQHDANIVSLLTQLTTTADSPYALAYEVLFDRKTHIATKVDTYSYPCRVGRVWQRAGFPQGTRGPDRGGYGYGGRPWAWKPQPHCG